MLFQKKNRKPKTGDPTSIQRRADRRAEQAEARADKSVQNALALRTVVGHVTLTRAEVVAWFVLRPHSTSFRDHGELESRITDGATSLSRLGAVRTYWRVTSRPLSVRTWAERSYADAKAAGEPLPGFGAFLEREQRRMQKANLTEKIAYLGVRVAERRRHPYDPRREVKALQEQLAEVADHMGGRGLEAEPATPEQMELLLRRSVALGMPSPRLETIAAGDWDQSDLPQLEQSAQVTAEPFARVAQVRHVTDRGEELTRHVAVLTMGKIGNRLNIPQDNMGGWMQRTDLLGFPVEWMGTVDLIDPADARAALRHQMDIIQDQWEHYTVEHKIPPPELLKQQHTQALAAEHELDAGLTGETTRTHGWFRLAVWGETAQEALRRVGLVRRLYGQQVEWWHSGGQVALVREFVPGQPLANTAHRRRFVLPSVFAAMPAATSQIGDGYGAAVGATSGTSRTGVSLALWRDMEDKNRERSGLMIVGGGLGSGKSFFGGGLIYRTAMAGVMWSVLDPSGRLGSLCDVPELREHSRYYDLTKGQGGELSPYLVVAEPAREQYPDSFAGEAEWQNAVRDAQSTRRMLMVDTLNEWLPAAYDRNQKVSSILSRATKAVPAEVTTPAMNVLEQIKRIADGQAEDEFDREYRILARDIYEEVIGQAESFRGRLIFGESEDVQRSDHLLEVYGLQGIAMPTAEQLAAGNVSTTTRVSIALFSLAAWKVQARTFQASRDRRKGLFFDEGHLLSQFPSGPGLIAKASVDSRKHNTRAIMASQNVTHFDLSNLSNLAGMVAIGKTTDEKESGSGEAALTLLGRPSEPRYLRALAGLSRPPKKQGDPHFREFVIATKDDTGSDSIIEQCVFDMYAHPHVIEYLNTTPGQHRDEATTEEGGAA